jgi:hypothetical protein
MRSRGTAARLRPDEADTLCRLLDDEESQYRRLRRLAWRQTAYLKRRDVSRLEKNAGEWRQFVPLAEGARRRREEQVALLAERCGARGSRLSGPELSALAAEPQRSRIRAAVQRLAATASDLYRQNGLNALLARFCLELVQQEADIFRRVVTGDPAGGYADDGKRATAPTGGVVWRQA